VEFRENSVDLGLAVDPLRLQGLNHLAKENLTLLLLHWNCSESTALKERLENLAFVHRRVGSSAGILGSSACCAPPPSPA
jgi:hypothetical protein